MAETLTYENTTETTSIDNLSEEEQDSLQVGEAMQEAQDNLLAGKYKNAEELEKAHIELQKKLGNKEAPTEEVEEEEAEPASKKENDTPSESSVLDDLWDEVQSGEKLSDKVLGRLKNSNPAELAKLHLEYRSKNTPRDLSEKDVTELKGIAGGEKEYTAMLDWANKNLNEQEINMFDTVMERGDPLAAFFAVRSLSYRYKDSTGVEGKMLTGSAPKSSRDQFRSQAELVRAMDDSRYDNDPAYRQDVMRKLERSNLEF